MVGLHNVESRFADERRRFTVDEVLRMVELGVLGEDEPIELLDGELVVMSPQGTSHRFVMLRLARELSAAYGEDAHVVPQVPMLADELSLPEPDVAVVRGQLDDYRDRFPTGPDMILVVEVSNITQKADRAKAALYARAGVAEYWRLDLPSRTLELHREPADQGYGLIQVLSESDEVDVPGLGARWRIADLLP